MTTSGSYDFSVSGDDIIKDALLDLNVIYPGQSLDPDMVADARRSLNALTKQWMGPPNYLLPGDKVWQRDTTTLTLTATASYTIKPGTLAYTSGGTTEISVGDTITGATSAFTATVIAVSLTSGTWAAGDAAGNLTIVGQSGTFVAENLNVGASTNVASIAADSDQGGGGKDILVPVKILVCYRRNSDGIDTPMTEMGFDEYQAIGDKDASGTPTRYLYERKTDAGYLTLNCVPSDTDDTIIVTFLRQLQDIDASANTPDFPKEWYRPLKWNLALELASGQYEVSDKKYNRIEKRAMESLGLAQTFTPENAEDDMYFQPDKDI